MQTQGVYLVASHVGRTGNVKFNMTLAVNNSQHDAVCDGQGRACVGLSHRYSEPHSPCDAPLHMVIACAVTDGSALALRGRNLTGEYSDYASTDIYVATPRSFA